VEAEAVLWFISLKRNREGGENADTIKILERNSSEIQAGSQKMQKVRNRAEFEDTKLAEKGKVLTYTIIRVPPHQFVDQAPFAVGIAELDDGVKLTGQIVDCDFEDLKIGQRVKIEFRKIYDEGEAGIICYGYKFVPE